MRSGRLVKRPLRASLIGPQDARLGQCSGTTPELARSLWGSAWSDTDEGPEARPIVRPHQPRRLRAAPIRA
jgi:hypothetical protein